MGLILSVALTGCVSLDVSSPIAGKSGGTRNVVSNVNLVTLGMSYKQVVHLMENQVKIGYQLDESKKDTFKPITVRNPRRYETIEGSGGSYHVLYYFTHIDNPDGIIAEDEMTPFIFQDNKLVGKGWDTLFKLRDARQL